MGSNLNFRVESRPVVVVAAWVMERAVRRGMRKVDVQPAPRMRMSISFMAVVVLCDRYFELLKDVSVMRDRRGAGLSTDKHPSA